MKNSNDPILYIVPLLIIGTIALIYALSPKNPNDRFRYFAFVLIGYGGALMGVYYVITKNIKSFIIGIIIIMIVHFAIFRTSEEFYNKYIKKKK